MDKATKENWLDLAYDVFFYVFSAIAVIGILSDIGQPKAIPEPLISPDNLVSTKTNIAGPFENKDNTSKATDPVKSFKKTVVDK